MWRTPNREPRLSLVGRPSDVGFVWGTALFMSIRLLNALTEHYDLVESAATDPTIVVPSELDFAPRPGDDLESMIWVLTYAIMLRHQEGLQGPKKAQYELNVVDRFYGNLSYSGLENGRVFMVFHGSNRLGNDPERWIPDPAERKWFRCAMTLVADGLMSPVDGSIKAITFDAFDALCDEFIMDEWIPSCAMPRVVK